MSFSETIFLLLLALIIFGPKKLPEIARQIGKLLNDVKRTSNEFKSQIESEISNLNRETSNTILPPVPATQAYSGAHVDELPSTTEPPASLAGAATVTSTSEPIGPAGAVPRENLPIPKEAAAEPDPAPDAAANTAANTAANSEAETVAVTTPKVGPHV